MKKTLFIGITVAIIAAVAIALYTFRSSSDSVKGEKVEVEISTEELLLAFEIDENEANTAYLNKVILVTGEILEINELETSYSIMLKPEDASSGVMCGFSKKAFKAKPAKIGDIVAIKGLCTGYLLDVVLNKCAWED